MVIGDEDPDHCDSLGDSVGDFRDNFSADEPAAPVGTRTVTVVPFLWMPLIKTSPPKRNARSLIPTRPKDLVLEISLSVIPLPLSFTFSDRLSDSFFKLMPTSVAFEWRATLVSVS